MLKVSTDSEIVRREALHLLREPTNEKWIGLKVIKIEAAEKEEYPPGNSLSECYRTAHRFCIQRLSSYLLSTCDGDRAVR